MRCSASERFVLNHVRSYPEMFRKSVYSFMKCIHSSVNLIIMTIVNGGLLLRVYTFSAMKTAFIHIICICNII